MKNKKNMVVASVITPECLKTFGNISHEVLRQLLQGLENPGTGLTLKQLQLFVEHKNPFASENERILEHWLQFFRDIFFVGPNLFGLVVPPLQAGFDWVCVCPSQISLNAVWSAYVDQKIPRWSFYGDDLEAVVSHNDRDCRNGSYAVRIRSRWKAGDELKNLSANTLRERGVTTATLYERLLVGLYKWWATGGPKVGRHLDVQQGTFCAGSRCRDGSVPIVYSNGADVTVGWCPLDNFGDRVRARQVISSA